ncbi:FtsX-like permease family protein [Pontibacillus salicampi]|uniref:FtsX-like permease family protein n=1 Tax=Pontibacillus salicampi TaxID=1449801 RepID=A0ABV6LK48_9BACI
MTFRQFAFHNVFRNKRIYAAYFLSSVFSVLMFFAYAVFAFHPGLDDVAIGSAVSRGLHVAEGIIFAYSFFFVLFSMSSFLKSRKKELGLLVLHGMTNGQMRRMIFLENLIIGLTSIFTGIGIGLIFTKLMLLLAEQLLGLDGLLNFYIPTEALLLTFGSFLLLFMFISFFTVSVLRGNELITLIKGNKMPKTEPKVSKTLAILSALLLTAGYTIALSARGVQVSFALVPVTLLVIAGTYFFFTQLSMFIINQMKKYRSLIWKNTNLLLFSDLAYRVKDNARTFFLVSIISTVAFSAIGTLVGFKSMLENSIKEENPFPFVYSAMDDFEKRTQQQKLIETTLSEDNISYDKISITALVQTTNTPDDSIKLVKQSEYNKMTEAAGYKPVTISANHAIRVHHKMIGKPITPDINNSDGTIQLKEAGMEINPVKAITASGYPIYSPYYVVSDSFYHSINKSKGKQIVSIYDTTDLSAATQAGEVLSHKLPQSNFGGDYRFFARQFQIEKLNQGYGAILFVGLFIGVIFFVGAGSFLYFRLYNDLEEDKRKFKAISKIGLSEQELSRVLTIQIALLFFVPIIVAIIHGAVALTALQHMFHYSLVTESVLVLGAFFVIQLLYFLFIRASYIKKVKDAVL